MVKSISSRIWQFIAENIVFNLSVIIYFVVFYLTFDVLNHNLMPVTVLFSAYVAWFYGSFSGCASVAALFFAHAALLAATGKPSIASLFKNNPVLYFGVFTQVVLVFLVHYFKRIYNQLNDIKNKLEIANMRAAEADRIKNAFMADLSHEIRNPLCSIIGYAQILGDDENLTADQRSALEPVLNNSQHLMMLINKVLDFSKIESEAVSVESVEFDVAGVIEEVCGAHRFMAAKKGLNFEHRVKGDFENMRISDPLRIRQILINLVSNAIKFTSEGGVTVECEELERQGVYSRVCFRVTDTGPGLSEEELNMIFKPYKQASSNTERIYGGTGLGLVIADRLVRLIGGASIRVESVKGSYTTFSFELKMKLGEKIEKKVPVIEKSQPAAESAFIENRHLKILVTDDNLFNLTLLKAILEVGAHEILEATDGKKSLDMALAHKPDIIFLDIQLPEINGIEVARKIREAGLKMPILSITGDSSDDAAEECIKAGMNGTILKPFVPDDIYKALEKYAA